MQDESLRRVQEDLATIVPALGYVMRDAGEHDSGSSRHRLSVRVDIIRRGGLLRRIGPNTQRWTPRGAGKGERPIYVSARRNVRGVHLRAEPRW